jgi:hypothetical protein
LTNEMVYVTLGWKWQVKQRCIWKKSWRASTLRVVMVSSGWTVAVEQIHYHF